MSDFEEKLNAILSNPESMGQIMNLAQSLNLGGGGESGHQQRGGGQYGKCDFFHSFGMKGVMSTP